MDFDQYKYFKEVELLPTTRSSYDLQFFNNYLSTDNLRGGVFFI
jgi:hypothetical protein